MQGYMFYFVKRLITLALDRSNREREMASQALSSLYADVRGARGATACVLLCVQQRLALHALEHLYVLASSLQCYHLHHPRCLELHSQGAHCNPWAQVIPPDQVQRGFTILIDSIGGNEEELGYEQGHEAELGHKKELKTQGRA
eukprot:1152873-Pelagomonas_calceolata.AAC.4